MFVDLYIRHIADQLFIREVKETYMRGIGNPPRQGWSLYKGQKPFPLYRYLYLWSSTVYSYYSNYVDNKCLP